MDLRGKPHSFNRFLFAHNSALFAHSILVSETFHFVMEAKGESDWTQKISVFLTNTGRRRRSISLSTFPEFPSTLSRYLPVLPRWLSFPDFFITVSVAYNTTVSFLRCRWIFFSADKNVMENQMEVISNEQYVLHAVLHLFFEPTWKKIVQRQLRWFSPSNEFSPCR